MFSILHISDLHRSPAEPITNDELISALVRDRDRYIREEPAVRPPDAIVISGDLIQGVSLRTPAFIERLREQYETAYEFVSELASRFVAGDHSRVVLVPGNHDIDWNTARTAMTLVEAEETPPDVLAALHQEGSRYRWNWRTRELLFVSDTALYARRLDAFASFADRFYAGALGLVRVAGAGDANLFSLADGRIGVVGFNSCAGNDCFSFTGLIPRDVIGRSDLDLSEQVPGADLRIAVWHHNVEGPPNKSDYMDIDIVRGMIGRGFRLGLFGHQHKAQAVAQQVYLPDKETMAVVSAGSLCAGSRELPPGIHRQYNVVEISDDYASARVHVRAMSVSNLFQRASLPDFGGRSYVDLEWGPQRDPSGQPIDVPARRLFAYVAQAEAALQSGKANDAIEQIRGHPDMRTGYPRRLLVEAAVRAQKWDVVVEATEGPESIGEVVNRFEAFLRLRAYLKAREVLDVDATRVGVPLAQIEELRKRLTAEEVISR